MNVVSLFDLTGNIVMPWLNAGHDCWIVDIQHPFAYNERGVTSDGKLHRVHFDLSVPWLPPFAPDSIAIVFAFPPCDDLAVSGAAWFRGKGLRKLSRAINLFATAAEFCEWSGAPYLIENPKSAISTYWRPADFSFHPWEYQSHNSGDIHQKETYLWTGGGFVMPKKKTELTEAIDKDFTNNTGGANRKNRRSATPVGFAKAVYDSNYKWRTLWM